MSGMLVFIPRLPDGDVPGGLTVSKNLHLPDVFQITEAIWGDVRLWFVTQDNFTADDREAAYQQVLRKPELMQWATL